MIETDKQLAEFIIRLCAADWIAMDTEADSLHCYPEKLCLIQISIPGEDILIDPLSNVNLSPLWENMKARQLILHGSDYDLRLLYRNYGFVPGSIYDTMLAARLLGYEFSGLSHLVKKHFGVELKKSHQTSNWTKRPLSPEMELYAKNDTHYLKPLEECLTAKLIEKGRLQWHKELCDKMISDAVASVNGGQNEPWRIKGSNSLSPVSLSVLRSIWFWREQEAIAANKPPFFILPHQTLLDIAICAANGNDIDVFIPPKFSDRRLRSLKEAVKKGLNEPEENRPAPLRQEHIRLNIRQQRLFNSLIEKRDKIAAKLKIDPTLIANKSTIVSIAYNPDCADKLLMNWQKKLLFDN